MIDLMLALLAILLTLGKLALMACLVLGLLILLGFSAIGAVLAPRIWRDGGE